MKESKYSITIESEHTVRLLNTASGAVIDLSPEYYDQWKRLADNKANTISQEDKDTIIQLGFLVPHTLNEFQAVSSRRDQLFSDENLTLTLIVTKKCNFRCTYCYETHEEEIMTDDTWESLHTLIKKRVEKQGLKNLTINFFGGEPLLEYQRIIEFLLRVQNIMKEHPEIAFSGSIVTNGYLLTPQIYTKLIDLGITTYQITVDGFPKTHDRYRPLRNGRGTFKRVLTNLSDIHTLDIDSILRIRTNLNEHIELDYDRFLEFIREKYEDRYEIQFDIVKKYSDRVGEGKSNYSEKQKEELFLRVQKKCKELRLKTTDMFQPSVFSCKMSYPNSFTILPNGSISKCTVYFEKSFSQIGTIFELATKGRVEHVMQPQELTIEACYDCKLFPVCFSYTCPIARKNDHTCEKKKKLKQLITYERSKL